MKYLIETYKNQDIHYNDSSDKFECTFEMGEELKSTKRQSLNDVRNEIDQFVKANMNFKPFKAIKVSYGESMNDTNIIAIRKDGKYVEQRGDGIYKSYVTPEYIEKDLREYDENILSEYKRLQKEVEDLRLLNRAKQADLITQLKPIML